MSFDLTYLPVTASELPVSKIFEIGNEYIFEFRLNEKIDRIMMAIKDEDQNVLYTTKIVYGSPLYHAVVDGIDMDQDIVAFNVDDLLSTMSIDDTSVTSDNLGDTVFFYLV